MNGSDSCSTDRRLLTLSPEDNVAVARMPIEAGETIAVRGVHAKITRRIPTGHKLAVVDIAAGQKVLKYGAPIGTATQDIQVGDYVHTHNLQSDYLPTYTLDGNNPYLQSD